MCLAIPLLERIIVEEEDEVAVVAEYHQCCQEEERPLAAPQPSKERPALGATKAALVVNSAGPSECKKLSITLLRVVSNASDQFKVRTIFLKLTQIVRIPPQKLTRGSIG